MSMGSRSMMMMPNFPPFFWIFPFIFIVFILVFAFAVFPQIKRFLQSHSGQMPFSESHRNKDARASQPTSAKVPEELRTKARQMIEEIDWDIKLMEGQLETEKDKEARKKLQKEIEEKRQQYKSIIDKFGW